MEVRIVAGRDELRAVVARLAAEVSAAYDDGVVLVAVLKGGVIFLSDLARALTIRAYVDFLAVSSYSPGSGRVRLLKDLDLDIAGRHVLLVEDVIDTGLTLNYLLRELSQRSPASLAVCALVDKQARRLAPVDVRFVGFRLADEFLLGYGLDVQGRYRNLDVLGVGDEAALARDPDAHVAELYHRA